MSPKRSAPVSIIKTYTTYFVFTWYFIYAHIEVYIFFLWYESYIYIYRRIHIHLYIHIHVLFRVFFLSSCLSFILHPILSPLPPYRLRWIDRSINGFFFLSGPLRGGYTLRHAHTGRWPTDVGSFGLFSVPTAAGTAAGVCALPTVSQQRRYRATWNRHTKRQRCCLLLAVLMLLFVVVGSHIGLPRRLIKPVVTQVPSARKYSISIISYILEIWNVKLCCYKKCIDDIECIYLLTGARLVLNYCATVKPHSQFNTKYSGVGKIQ